ncbi:ribosomal L28 family-domain-containing protein [Poronia punctata]|nr:ribosomal L28 family-domain-containing protein [Poronia punctata]
MAHQQSIAPIRRISTTLLSSQPRATLLNLQPSHSATSTTTTRALSTTTPLQMQKPSFRTVPKDKVPPYPYGEFRTYKQRNRGLFGKTKIRFGNVVAEKYKNKSRTTWLPNRHNKRLWSQALGAFLRTKLTTSVLRTIDRLGGIDEYLLGDKKARIKELGPAGWCLRWKVMQTEAVQKRFEEQRIKMGLPPKNPNVSTTSTTTSGEEVGAFPSGMETGDLKFQEVMDEVDTMIKNEEEFVLGDPEEQRAVEAVAEEADLKEKVKAKAEEVVAESKPVV